MDKLLMFPTKPIFEDASLNVGKSLIVADGKFLIYPEHDLRKWRRIAILMFVPDALLQVVRQDVNKHFSKMLIRDAGAVPVAVGHPLGNMVGEILPVFALRKQMELSNALEPALNSTPFVLQVQFPP